MFFTRPRKIPVIPQGEIVKILSEFLRSEICDCSLGGSAKACVQYQWGCILKEFLKEFFNCFSIDMLQNLEYIFLLRIEAELTSSLATSKYRIETFKTKAFFLTKLLLIINEL